MLYKVEYWVQNTTDDTPQMHYHYICECSSDRSLKMYVSKHEKFYPAFSTTWKEIEDAPNFDFEIYTRSIKPRTLKEWDNGEKKRFVIVKKAITAKAREQLEKECDNMPRRPYNDYY